MMKRHLQLLIGAMTLLLVVPPATSAPKEDLWSRWQAASSHSAEG